MNWDDTGFLISKYIYNENSLISEFYTKNHGKISGIVFGGTSKKIKNYLQIGNQLHLNYNTKSENKLGYFKLEIQKVYSPIYFDNSQKLSCINSAMSLIRLLTAESQSNINIFFSKKSLTNLKPFKSVFKSLTIIFLSIKKFGIIFFSVLDLTIYTILLFNNSLVAKLSNSKSNPKVLSNSNSQKI